MPVVDRNRVGEGGASADARLALALALVALPSLLTCSREATEGPSARRTRKTTDQLLEEVRSLRATHRHGEALELLVDYGPTAEVSGRASGQRDELEREQASILLTLSRPREALPILEDLVARRPGDAGLAHQLARAHLALGESDRALSLLEALPPEHARAGAYDHARALVGSGREREATAVMVAALTVDPWDQELQLLLGQTLARQGQEALAAALLERYRLFEPYRIADQQALQLEFSGKKAAALQRRARAEQERGRLFRAMLLHNEALREDRGLVRAYLDLARLSIALERPLDALKGLSGLPREVPVLEVLAEAHERAGDAEKACAACRAALEKDRDVEWARKRLERLDSPAGAGEDAELESIRREARESQRGGSLSLCAPALLRLAEGYARLGKAREARELLLFLRELVPADREVASAIVRLCSDPADVFFRLGACRVAAGVTLRARFERELATFGLGPEDIRAVFARWARKEP